MIIKVLPLLFFFLLSSCGEFKNSPKPVAPSLVSDVKEVDSNQKENNGETDSPSDEKDTEIKNEDNPSEKEDKEPEEDNTKQNDKESGDDEDGEDGSDSNKRSCQIANGSGIETFDSSSSAWGDCKVSNCDQGYSSNANQTACDSFADFGTDLKSCKAKNYYDDAKNLLALTDQKWCGDFAGRFSKKPGAPANDYVYDWLLRGYWSKQNGFPINWADAVTYCTNLGSGFELPDAYKMLSLFSQNKDANEGYIDPVFDDNDRAGFWSSTQPYSSYAWFFLFDSADVYDLGIAYLNRRVRCFRPGPYQAAA